MFVISLLCAGGAAAGQSSPLCVTVSTPLQPQLSALDGAAITLTLEQEALAVLRPARRAIIDRFPLGPNLSVALDLKRIEAFAPDAKIVTATVGRNGRVIETPLPMPDVVLLGGRVAGVADSQAFLSLSPLGQHGWVRLAGRTYILSSGPFGANMPTMIYDAAALPEGAIRLDEFRCGTDALAPIPQDRTSNDGQIAGPGAPPCREVKIALDTDYEFTWNKFAGNPVAAATYAATIMAGCNQIYVTDLNTRLQISFLRLWTTPNDPWTQSSSGNQLGQFRDYWLANQASTPRTLAHMLSARGLGGGVAWLSVMCNSSYGYAVSGNINGSFPYPLQNNSSQNWDIMVFAHETGHNFSTTHTHNYDPPIDGCGLDPQDCSLAAQGTIMSYCHTCSPGMANIALTLHPIPIAYILNYFTGLTCNFVGSTLPPVAQDDRGWVLESGNIAMDVLANDLETNCDSVTLDGFATSSSQGGVVTLSQGTGPGGRDQLFYAAPSGYNGIDSFTYSIRDAGNQVSNATVSIRVYGYLPAANPLRFQAGAKARYYTLTSPSVLPDFNSLVPASLGTAGNINIPSTGGNFGGSGLADNLGAVYTGWVNVPSTGLYTFYVESDDGSRLWVDGEVVVANDGLHGMVERNGIIALQAGKHTVMVEFFEAGGGAGLVARYSGPGVSKQVIPAANWTRALPADLDENGSVNTDDLLMIIGSWGACVSGCAGDVNGDGQVNTDDLVLLVGSWG